MKVLITQGDKNVADISFEDEEILIGSHEDCDIHLPGSGISDRQARFFLDDSRKWHIENLDTQNEIQYNNQPLADQPVLHNKDQIAIGDYHLQVFPVEQEEGPPEEPRLGAAELAKIKKYPLPPGSAVKRHFDMTQLKTPQLENMAKANISLAGSRDIHELVDNVLDRLIEVFNARCAWIGLRRKPDGDLDVIAGKLATGKPIESTPLVEHLMYRCLERTQHICIRRVRDQQDIGSAMAAPLAVGQKNIGMIYVDRRPKIKRLQAPELELLSAIASQVAAKAENVFSGMIQRNAQMSTAEMDLVREIQNQLDPKSTPNWSDLSLAVYTRSGQEAPGDVYDIMSHPDTGMSYFLVGHVHADGGSLAYSLSRLQAAFRVAMLHNDPPHAFARTLNWMIAEGQDTTTADLLCLQLNPKNGSIKFARGGKIGGFIVNEQGQARALKHASEQRVGQVPNFQYNSHLETLNPGESLILYSRGVTNVFNAEGNRFGEARFIELICDGFGQPPTTTIQDLTDEVTSFIEHGRQPEDITVLMLSRMNL
jgi:serine phosphatase RsbU (regulator of sigma subunit)